MMTDALLPLLMLSTLCCQLVDCGRLSGSTRVRGQASKSSRRTSDQTDCGRTAAQTLHDRLIVKRIVGGVLSPEGAWPWQVALSLNSTVVCGGSLIAADWVVTAWHCFTDPRSSSEPSYWSAAVGVHHKSPGDRFEQTRKIRRIYRHPKYQEKTLNGVLIEPPQYDIALLQLDGPIASDRYMHPICLSRALQFPPGKTCYISGWGSGGWGKPFHKTLQQAPIRLISRKECNGKLSYNGTVPLTALCAGYEDGRIDACQKDSGGPLACAYRGRWYLAGVISWGKKCARPHKYGVYTDVRLLVPWIQNIIDAVENL